MDELCASGEVVWVGAGNRRVALYFRSDVSLLGPPPFKPGPVDLPEHELVRARLRAGPCFFTDLLVDVSLSPEALQSALWDLVWAGEATNDAFAPLRAPRLTAAKPPSAVARAAGRRFGSRRAAGGPRGAAAQVQGRWSLTTSLFAAAVDPVTRRRAIGELMLERYGILTREQVLAEGVPGGFSAIYPELSQLETLGTARRGYFVEGLGGAQFALPGAVERLRSVAEEGAPLLLSAVDPAQPFGAALRWPDREDARPARVAGAYVVLCAGDPVLYVERGGRGLQTLVDAGDPRLSAAVDAVVAAVRSRRIKRLGLEKVDGRPALASPLGPALIAAGFVEGPRRLTLTG
jgi:ATP-dependent Lhr-like helicase